MKHHEYLQTLIVVVCSDCGQHDRVPTTSPKRTALKDYMNNRHRANCFHCNSFRVVPVIAEEIKGRQWKEVNGLR